VAEQHPPLSVVVLISGNGSNLQAIFDAVASGELHAEVHAVISNRAGAYGLQRARRYGVRTEILDHRQFPTRERYDHALAELIDAYTPDVVVLAGFMRILTPEFVQHYHARMLNIHPSLLPRHRGLNTHARVLQAGDTEHGVTIHFVTPDLDSGPIIAQARFPVHPDDDEASLEQRVHEKEHKLYPRVLGWFAQRRVRLDNDTVFLDGKPLDQTGFDVTDL